MPLIEVSCSLKFDTSQDQMIKPGDYQIVRFPFEPVESSDVHDLHPVVQPDTGQSVTLASQRAGLIWPAHSRWARLWALMYWADGPYTEVRSRFVRDPLNLSTGYDSTASEDSANSPGGQYKIKGWEAKMYPGTPWALMVWHNADVPVKLDFAEFKMIYSYWEDPA